MAFRPAHNEDLIVFYTAANGYPYLPSTIDTGTAGMPSSHRHGPLWHVAKQVICMWCGKIMLNSASLWTGIHATPMRPKIAECGLSMTGLLQGRSIPWKRWKAICLGPSMFTSTGCRQFKRPCLLQT